MRDAATGGVPLLLLLEVAPLTPTRTVAPHCGTPLAATTEAGR